MVLDAAKGIEAQTRKLFEVCRLRDVPIFTFINKLDRQARDPFELIDEIESGLAISTRSDELADRHGPIVPGRVTISCTNAGCCASRHGSNERDREPRSRSPA